MLSNLIMLKSFLLSVQSIFADSLVSEAFGKVAPIKSDAIGVSTNVGEIGFIGSFINSSSYSVVTLICFISVFYCWYKHRIYFTLLSIVISAVLVQRSIEFNLHKEHENAVKLDVIKTLSTVSARLDGNLKTNLSMITGFAAYISAVPNLSEEEFADYAKELFKKEPLLINFAAARGLVVNYVYPFEPNKSVIGLDYRQNEEQRTMALQVAQTGKMLVAGPVNLVQGGTAFIGRAPIFSGKDDARQFWGIISAPLDANELYRMSGFFDVNESIDIAIRKRDLLGKWEEAFKGNPQVFQTESRLSYLINVGDTSWEIAAVANPNLYPLPNDIAMVRFVFFVVTMFICSFVIFRYRQQSQQRRLEASLQEYRRLLEKVGSVANIGGWKLDTGHNFTQWTELTSKTLQQADDYSPKNLSSLEPLFASSDYRELRQAVDKAFIDGTPVELECQLNAQNHVDTWVKVIAKINDDADESKHITGTFQDVSSKVRSARIIEHQASYDALTNLPNRILFNDRLTHAIEDAKRNNSKLGVLFIDLDRFKPVNDNYGHLVGDQLLIESAKRISEALRHSDTVSRLSGDEFGVLICDIDEYENVVLIADKILQSLQRSYELDNVVIHSSASIGISLFPEDGDEAQALVRKADQAMYEVKSSGRNGKQFYTLEMQVKSEHKHLLLNDLIDAINDRILVPYFQPIVDLQDEKITKCEALARWPKEDGFVPPSEFIELAEESGLINKIDLYILQVSAQALVENLSTSHPVELSVNVSPRLFQTKDKALELWLECIENYASILPITVEITERLLTDDSAKALEVLTKLKEVGVKIAIDDFGTGYSSLSYLIKFPVDSIKIDRAFIDKIGVDNTSEALIETILLMAQRLEIDVVAEGIETRVQLEFLRKFGCRCGQGYFLGRPMPMYDFFNLVKNN